MHELTPTDLPLPPGDTSDAQTSRPNLVKPTYLPPEIISLTETDILAALGPAHTGSMENPFDVDGMGGM